MIYAIRRDGERQTLVEVSSSRHLGEMTPIAAGQARQWVLAGKLHETGLWIDETAGGRRVVRYAQPEADAQRNGDHLAGRYGQGPEGT